MNRQFGGDGTGGGTFKSARVLRAYFEHKFQVALELLLNAPANEDGFVLRFGHDLEKSGFWGLRSSAPLGVDQQKEIGETFRLILGSLDGLHSYHRELGHLQSRLEFNRGPAPTNVIPLRRGPFLERVPSPKPARDKRWMLKLDCLIESQYISEIHKMALELHSHSNRYAFVEYRDLSHTCRASLTDLLDLGTISLFVPSVLDLRPREQAVLAELTKQRNLERPLLMVGATMPYSSLRGEPGVNQEFLMLLSRAYIKLTRPFTEYKEQGLIHYFLDSLSENPT